MHSKYPTVFIILIPARIAGNSAVSIIGQRIEETSFVDSLSAIKLQHSSAVFDTYENKNHASTRAEPYAYRVSKKTYPLLTCLLRSSHKSNLTVFKILNSRDFNLEFETKLE